MLVEDPQAVFDDFAVKAKNYLDSPGIMAALELDKLCSRLAPMVARMLKNTRLSNQIRDFGRGLPRKEPDELRLLLQDIFIEAKAAGLSLPD